MSLLSGLFGKNPVSSPVSRAAARTAKMEARIEGLRKGSATSKDAQIRGAAQATSARDYLAKSLGKSPGPSRASSVGRLTESGSMSFGSTLAPRLPPMKK